VYLLFKEVATSFPQFWRERKDEATVAVARIANRTLIIPLTIVNPKEIFCVLLFDVC
jgi:hypothetical protein